MNHKNDYCVVNIQLGSHEVTCCGTWRNNITSHCLSPRSATEETWFNYLWTYDSCMANTLLPLVKVSGTLT